MLIGLWDWDRVEGQLRSGWRSREVQVPREGERPLKWHLIAQKGSGRGVSLDVCKGMGVKISEITHTSAERLGLPRNTTYSIFAKGNRLATCFRARGVDSIQHAITEGVGGGEPPAWEGPDVLLSEKDAERLEGFLYAGWHRDLEAQEEEATSGGTVARTEGAAEQRRGEPRGVIQNLEHQAYADDTTIKARGSGALGTREHGSDEKGWTYVQRIRTGVEGQGVELRVMFNKDTPHSLIL